MRDWIYYVISSVFFFGIAVASLSRLARYFIEHNLSKEMESYKINFSKDLEQFKMQLQANKDRSIEETRHQLEMLASEHNIRFGKLHEKRAETIAELHSKLDDAIVAANVFLNIFRSEGQNAREHFGWTANEKMGEVLNYYQKHKIYFDKELCNKLNYIFSKLIGPIVKFRSALSETSSPHAAESEAEMLRAWTTAYEELADQEIPEVQQAIEDDFRKLLGV